MPQLTLASDFPGATEDDWLERVARTLKGRSVDSLESETLDGIRLKPVYRGVTDPGPVPRRAVGDPPWTIMQRVDIPDVGRANAQAREDLANGAGGLVLVWPGSVGAGDHGIMVSTLDDLKRLTDGIDIERVVLRLDAGAFGQQAAGLILDLCEARNIDPARCDVAFGLDPLGALALTGLADDEAALRRDLAGSVAAIAGRGHRGPANMVDTRAYHGAGSAEAQELAAALATAIQYLRWLEAEGHDV
ncbi:MAG: methylmalonyl-CoA mutase family protein, partial [Hyphomicrobiales bacterium]